MNSRKIAKDTDSGQLSMDFLVGIAIFMLGLIIVISMVSGILAHIQGKTIDYDAVAYRTGVILVEDPGYYECLGLNCPDNPPIWFLSKYPTNTEKRNISVNGSEWELLADEPMLHQYIQRIGLYNSVEGSSFGEQKRPNRDGSWVLSNEKVNRFFTNFSDSDIYNNAIFGTYRVNKTISVFGENPVDWGQIKYNFNISLKTRNKDGSWGTRTVGQIPANNAGYIKRVVKIKTPENEILGPGIIINGSSYSTEGDTLTIRLPFLEIYNNTIGQNYYLDIRNSAFYINISKPSVATIKNITISVEYENPQIEYPMIDIFIDGVPQQSPNFVGELNPPTGYDISNKTIWFAFPKTFFSNNIFRKTSNVNISFGMAPGSSSGFEEFNYQNVTPPDLLDGVLEVKIW